MFGKNFINRLFISLRQSSIRRQMSKERNVSTDFHLIGSQIIFRHGARTPLAPLHGLDEVSYLPEHLSIDESSQWQIELIRKFQNEIDQSNRVLSANEFFKDKIRSLKSINGENVVSGQLTSIGEKQLFQLGQSMQHHLFVEEDLPIPREYHHDFVFCRSTFMNRTISSARAFLAGFFTFDGQIRANGPFKIEVQHFPSEDLFPNPRLYPILNECTSVEKLYQIFDDQHHLKIFRQEILRRLGLEESRHGIVELSDDLVSRQAHGFEIPPHLHEFMEHFDVYAAEEFVEMAKRIDLDLFLRCTCGSLLTSIKKHFDSIYQNYLRNSSIESKERFFIYSGHDTTLIPLAMAFQIFDNRWPKYGSHLLIKFYVSKTNQNERFLTVHFANQIHKLFSHDSIYCPYSLFVKSLENRFA